MTKSRSHPKCPDDATPAPGDALRWFRDLKQGVRDATARAAMLTGKELNQVGPAQPAVAPPSTPATRPEARATARAAQGRPFPGAPAVPAGAFTLEGSATLDELLWASVEVW